MTEETPEILWYVDHGTDTVQQVEALPRVDDQYWIPSLNRMGGKGHGLFGSRDEAYDSAIRMAQMKILNAETQLRRLRNER